MSAAVVDQTPRARLLAALAVGERRMDLEGISTAVLESGEGRPVLLLHGPGGYAAHWMGVIRRLAGKCRVIAPDLPGHGASRVMHGDLHAPRVMAWLGSLIERTCASPPVLVGQLLGGAIAARFAVEHSERLHRLVLVDTFGLVPFQPSPEFGEALTAFQAQPTEITHEALWRQCAHDLPGLRQRMGALWEPFASYNIELACTPGVRAAIQGLMAELGAPAIAEADLRRIAVPTALMWGRHDLATPLSVARAASERYGWPLEIIEGANDDPPVEQPDALVRALTASLA